MNLKTTEEGGPREKVYQGSQDRREIGRILQKEVNYEILS